jgi:hypothetical protein
MFLGSGVRPFRYDGGRHTDGVLRRRDHGPVRPRRGPMGVRRSRWRRRCRDRRPRASEPAWFTLKVTPPPELGDIEIGRPKPDAGWIVLHDEVRELLLPVRLGEASLVSTVAMECRRAPSEVTRVRAERVCVCRRLAAWKATAPKHVMSAARELEEMDRPRFGLMGLPHCQACGVACHVRRRRGRLCEFRRLNVGSLLARDRAGGARVLLRELFERLARQGCARLEDRDAGNDRSDDDHDDGAQRSVHA